MDELRKQLKLSIETGKVTVAQLANELGVVRQTVYDWRDGRYAPHLDVAERLAAALGLELTLVRILPPRTKTPKRSPK